MIATLIGGRYDGTEIEVSDHVNALHIPEVDFVRFWRLTYYRVDDTTFEFAELTPMSTHEDLQREMLAYIFGDDAA